MTGFNARDPLNKSLHLTPTDVAAWDEYETAAKKAQVEYVRRPSAKPRIDGLTHCLACATLTSQFGVCLSCQIRDPEWRAIAADHDAIVEIRRADLFSGRRWPPKSPSLCLPG